MGHIRQHSRRSGQLRFGCHFQRARAHREQAQEPSRCTLQRPTQFSGCDGQRQYRQHALKCNSARCVLDAFRLEGIQLALHNKGSSSLSVRGMNLVIYDKAMSNELSAQELLPPEIGLTLLGFEKSEQGWLVRAEGRTRSECPPCGTQSTARHSRYWRQLQDLPVQGKRVALQLRLSRWRCRNRECEQAIFRERLGEVVAPWARRTSRVEELLVGHCTGGRAAEFLLKRLAMAVSDDTILRRIKRRARAARHGEQRLRVVGVDDWAWKKGQSYGTILVDLERRTVADLLPQRSADQLAEWLKQHPKVEVISRDRFGLYAGGARRGAPHARQVADRFHLLLNLREVVSRRREIVMLYERWRRALRSRLVGGGFKLS
jgi:hypothetical protein